MSKHSDESAPLLQEKKVVGRGALTLESFKALITSAGFLLQQNRAQELCKTVRLLPMDVRKEILEDFEQYRHSAKLANGNHTVYWFYNQVIMDYCKDTGNSLTNPLAR
jgi:hypothetical protein